MPLSFQRSSPAARRRTRRQAAFLLLLAAIGLAWLGWYAGQVGLLQAAPELTPSPSPDPTQASEAGQTPPVISPGSLTLTPLTSPIPIDPGTPLPAELTLTAPTASPTAPATPTPTPPLISQLLFLSEGRLGRWDPSTDRVSPAVQQAASQSGEQIVAYSASESGRWVAVLRQMGLTPDGPHDLALLDTATRRMTTLVEGSSRLHHILISPNGAWVAYTTQANGGSVYALPVDQPQSAVLLGRCTQVEELRCAALPVWGKDVLELYWSDERGVLRASIPNPAEVILPGRLEVQDPRGQITPVDVAFQNLSPSPIGRYLLAQTSPLNSEVTWQALIDTRIIRVAEVAGTYRLEGPAAEAGWMMDGRLFEVVTDPEPAESANIRIWRVLPTREDLMLMQSEWNFPMEDLRAEMRPAWIVQHDERYVSFVLRPAGPEGEALLLRLDLRYRSLSLMNTLPFDPVQVRWSPDLRGALAAGPGGEIIFAPDDGSQPFSLEQQLGANASAFTWLPPAAVQP
jgi:hypothetical protein